MRKPTQPKQIGRGERVQTGVWRLRLPLPWPGVPHCNAWAIASGNGVVLVDTGMHGAGSLAHLERALEQVNLKLEHVRLVVVTHAHSDHCGQAMPIAERVGCEVWMHPNHAHQTAAAEDPESALARRVEVARQSGVPEAPLAAWVEARKGQGPGIAGTLRADRDLLPGVVVDTDLGPWTVHETPGHAPSHVVLHQADRRLMLSGDHLLGRVSLYYDYGWSPDPVGEFLASLDHVESLDTRLALSGHGRPFTDVAGHIEANRALVHQRLDAVRAALAREPLTAFEMAPVVYGEMFMQATAQWLMTKLLCYLEHLERGGEAERVTYGAEGRRPGGEPAGRDLSEPERWRAAAS